MSTTATSPISQATAVTSPPATTITYAPYIKPVAGTYELYSVAIVWEDNPGADLAAVRNCGNKAAETFKNLSNGQFILQPHALAIKVPYTRASDHVTPAVAYAKKQIKPTSKNVIYAFVNNYAQGDSHSAGNTSNILNPLATTFLHEIGRDDPINLGSSGAYQNGKYVYQADGTTIMGHFSSDKLTASQSYGLGWLPNTKVALFSDVTQTMEFTLDPLDSTATTQNLKAVLIPKAPNTSKAMFLSRPTLTDGAYQKNPKIVYALHLAVDDTMRGSERLLVFGGKKTTCRGLDFEEVSTNGNATTIRISPTPQAKPK